MDDRYLRELARRETLPLPESYDRRMDRLCEEIRAGTLARPKHRLPYRRTLLLAAVIAVLLSVSVLAASGALSGILDHFREQSGGLTPEQEALIQQGTAALDESVTDNGVTVTLKEAYSDGTSYLFYLTLEAPEGTVLDGFPWFDSVSAQSEAWDCSYFMYWRGVPDEDPTDNRETLLVGVNIYFPANQEPPQGGERVTCTLRLKDLEKRPDEFTRIPFIQGEWILETTVICDGTQETMDLEGVYLNGIDLMNQVFPEEIRSITLRPLGARCYYEAQTTMELGLYFKPIFVILEDGSEIQLHSGGGGGPDDAMEVGIMYEGFQADSPIPLDQVQALRLGEQVIPWEPQGESR